MLNTVFGKRWPVAALALAIFLGGCAVSSPRHDWEDRLGGDTIVLLGEIHDNAEHHRQRLQVLRRAFAAGWRPAIVMVGRQHVERALAQGRGAIVWAIHTAFASNIVKMAMHAASWRLSQVSRPEHGLSDSEFGMACLNRVRTDFEEEAKVESEPRPEGRQIVMVLAPR